MVPAAGSPVQHQGSFGIDRFSKPIALPSPNALLESVDAKADITVGSRVLCASSVDAGRFVCAANHQGHYFPSLSRSYVQAIVGVEHSIGHSRSGQRGEGDMSCNAQTFAGEPTSVAVARGWVTDVLRANGWGRPLTGIAALVTSELVTNAVKYTDGPVRVELLIGAFRVRISVIDAGTETSAPTVARSCPDPELAEAARGLYLVDRWAERIGIRGDRRGRTVFADICAHSSGPEGAATRVAGVLPRRLQGAAFAEQRGGFS